MLVYKETDDVGVFKKDCRKDRQLKMLFGGCPREYIDILRIIDGHRFFDSPDYSKIYGHMRNAMVSCRSQVSICIEI
uniref:Retrotransposon protein n=1 Tax=Steinernema glaseri TaxID=37863 RepID=A0A1I7ZE56_9BILA